MIEHEQINDTWESPDAGRASVGDTLRDVIADKTPSNSDRHDFISNETRQLEAIKLRNAKDQIADPHQLEAYNRLKRRTDIMSSVREVVAKEPTVVSRTSLESPEKHPASEVLRTMSPEAQHEYSRMSPKAQADHLRTLGNAQRSVETAGEIARALEPYRADLARAGITNDVEAVKQVLAWKGAIANPETGYLALQQLAAENNIDLNSGRPAQENYEQAHERTSNQVAEVSAMPHFQFLSPYMEKLLQAHPELRNGPNPAKRLYEMTRDFARKNNLLPKAEKAQPAKSESRRQQPPRDRAPSLKPGSSVRDSILAAMRR